MLIAPQPARWGRSQAAIYQDCAGRPAQACDCECKWRTFRGPWRRGCAPGRLTFLACPRTVSKKAPRHPGLRFAQTSLLTGTVLLPNHLRRVENAACGFSTERRLVDNAARLSTLRITFKHARTDSPVRRVAEDRCGRVKSQGCDESCAEPWTALRSEALERRWTMHGCSHPAALRAPATQGAVLPLLVTSPAAPCKDCRSDACRQAYQFISGTNRSVPPPNQPNTTRPSTPTLSIQQVTSKAKPRCQGLFRRRPGST